MSPLLLAIAAAVFTTSFETLGSPLCEEWRRPTFVGQLDSERLPESSGLAVSRAYPQRLYHVNDTSGALVFLQSRRDLSQLQTISVEGPLPIDTEDLAYGPCGDGGNCLFLADIGDNAAARSAVLVTVIKERELWPERVVPEGTLRMKYPDGPRDAEALTVSPDGQLYIMSKNLQGDPSLYRLPVSWSSALAQVDRVWTLEKVRTVPLSEIIGRQSDLGRAVTAMDLSADGSRLLLLTYGTGLEIDFSALLNSASADTLPFRRLRLPLLFQEEAIAYTPDGRGLFVSSERRLTLAPVYRTQCRLPVE